MTHLVTIVVPIYNVDKYLADCLDSLEAQTRWPECRVVLVDDGSTDSSSQIAADFAGRHPSVQIISQANAGPGVARNRGLAEVTTPFIAFCDSDDLLPADAIENLLSAAQTTGADIAVGNMATFPVVTTWPWSKYFGHGSQTVESVSELPDLIHGAGPCNKLFRTEFFSGLGLKFDEQRHFEDVYVTVPALLSARIALVDEVVYLYRKRTGGGSLMDSLFTREANFWDHLAVEEHLAALGPGLKDGPRAVLDQFLVRSFQGFALRAPDVIGDSDLGEFFARCRLVYNGLSHEVIRSAALDTRHRVAFVAFVTDDFELFRDRSAVITSLQARDGALFLALRDQIPAGVLELLRVDRFRAHLEWVEVSAQGDFSIAGRIVVNGLPLRTQPTFDLALRVRGSSVTIPAISTRRMSARDPLGDHAWSGFTASIPRSRLKDGLHDLRIVVSTATGQASSRTRPSQGYLRSARTLRSGPVRVVALSQAEAGCQLLVHRRTASTPVRAWRRLLLRADLDHVLHRRPAWRLRLIRTLTAPLFRNRSVWLVGERVDTAQDNSWHLFRHLRTQEPSVDAYYVIDKKSVQAARLRGLGNIIQHSSWRHRLLTLHARALINSYDIDSYLLPRQWPRRDFLQHVAWRVASRRIFLQHGVIYNDVSGALHRGTTGLDLFLTSAAAEAEFIRGSTGYGSQVRITGLPRFDNLTRVRRDEARILLMPTWRTYLVSPSYQPNRIALQDFEGSRYEAFLHGLLDDPELRRSLDQNAVTLEVLPHYEMAQAVQSMSRENPRIHISHHDSRDVQQAIRECDLLVTDWSSSFFDAAWMGTPVVLTPFDEEEFRAHQYAKGYFDLERDGFGPVARTSQQAVRAILTYMDAGFVREDRYTKRVNDFFAFTDRSNNSRTVTAIRDVLS